MKGAFIILLFTSLVGLILWWLDRRKTADESGENRTMDPPTAPEGEGRTGEMECCGKHLICEKTSLTPLSAEPEYFDDEELDRFRGRSEDAYSDDETEEFRHILLTMKPEEVPAWVRSLQVRGIIPPADLRDEILMIASDLRFDN